jgi:uncharacterized membrane protein YbhN (UPF0104 family)
VDLVPVIIAFSALTYLASAISLLGSVAVRLPFWGVTVVGVNALAGAIVHAILLVIFFSWAGRGLGRAFKLPSSSTLLVILAVVAAVAGLVMITRQGRRFAVRRLLPPVEAFGVTAGIGQIGAVYLGASLVAAASPTPGGLGAMEVATIAGLTSIGISSGPAVSAVLLYRLATYWLPVPPGWLSWRLLQRMEYV